MSDLRYKLILGKLDVKRVARTPTGWSFVLYLPGLGGMMGTAPPEADIREGDMLTLYTEILVTKPVVQ